MENNLFNLPSFNVLIIFLMISDNYLAELIPCNVQKLLNSNKGMLLKHIIAYLTLVFFVSLNEEKFNKSMWSLFKKSTIIYLLFLLLTKNNKYTFFIVMLLLLITYIMYLTYKTYLNNNKQDLNKLQNSYLNNYEKINKIFNYLIFVILIIGFMSYLGQKKYEYKSKFSYLNFILGVHNCAFSKSELTFFKSLQYLFM